MSANPMRQWPSTHWGEPRSKRRPVALPPMWCCACGTISRAPRCRGPSVSKGVPQRTAPGALGWCTRMRRFATRAIGNLYTNKARRKRADVSDPELERRVLRVYDKLRSTGAAQLARLRYAGATVTPISASGYSLPSPDVDGHGRDRASKANRGTFGVSWSL